MSHFKSVRRGIKASFTPAERMYLSDLVPMLSAVGDTPGDPAADRLRVPVYLDDPEANQAWWLLMGQELDEARTGDRSVFNKIIRSDDPVVLDDDEANAILRVLNEARLVGRSVDRVLDSGQ